MKHQMTDDKEISAYQYDPRGLCFRCYIETIRKTFYPGCPVVPTVEESQIFGAKGIAHACPQSSDCAVMCGRNKGRHSALPQLFLLKLPWTQVLFSAAAPTRPEGRKTWSFHFLTFG